MAHVSLAAGATGSEIGLSGNDRVFYVETGTVYFSSDDGTTYIPFAAGEKVIFSDGLTVTPQNRNVTAATFAHMPL
jgi:hypothetical protein